MGEKLSDWDLSESLQREDYARLYLEEIAKDGDPQEISDTIGSLARAIGMVELAKRAGVPVAKLYEAVNAWPSELAPLLKILKALGVEVRAAESHSDAAE